jgi:hypothetical protein
MNKQIKELAEQAGLDRGSYDRYGLFDEEKFAELIVRECADIADFCDQVESVEAVSSVLKRHFGVEE